MIVCGDHFGLVVDRPPCVRDSKEVMDKDGEREDITGLVGLVDAAIKRGDRAKALELLSLEASHGRVRGREGK